MSHRPIGAAPARLVAVLGPTNTGKTHLAVERMLGHASGMIGLPLRLLAREIYDRVVQARGARAVALITGEEKIVPPRAHYLVCTVEAMPVEREVEFLAVDEIQLAADPERGHVFTDRLLHARGRLETMFLGAAGMAPLIRRLVPGVEIAMRERLSTLSFSGRRKLTRLPKRSAVVAFSAEAVYAIAELIRRQRGGAAVVMGALSPRTRNAQVALYQGGEVDFLVATDAIGMGLNMDVGHVAFAGLAKFDGRRNRPLTAAEIGQIAGRAGRFQRDGAFGLTGEAEDLDPEVVEQVEAHAFAAVTALQWRARNLEFTSPAALIGSLGAAPGATGLALAPMAADEATLRALAADPAVVARAGDRGAVRRLWRACQLPDFRKLGAGEHARLVGDLFARIAGEGERAGDDWMAAQMRGLDRVEGEIDALQARLAAMRTLAYIAQRGDWLADPAPWREITRQVEDRLSDALHEKLVARFVDKRTSALLRGLERRDTLLAGVAADGAVTIEGAPVGRLEGIAFRRAAVSGEAASPLAERTLRAAAGRALVPEINRRLGALAASADAVFALAGDGEVLWRGEAVASLANDRPFAPRARLHGELGAPVTRERAARRIEAFLAAEAGRRLAALKRLEHAVGDGRLTGLARGLAFRIAEAGGAIARADCADDVGALSQAERRALRELGVRIAAFSLHLPALLAPGTRIFAAPFAVAAEPGWRPAGGIARLGDPAPSPRALGLRGLIAAPPLALDVEALARLEVALRETPTLAAAQAALGCGQAEAAGVLRALGYRPARGGEIGPWRRGARPAPSPRAPAHSVFASLATLKAPATRRRRRSSQTAARG